MHPDFLRERINTQLAMLNVENPEWELDWSSVYSARALTLKQHINERVIFAADAGHLLPICIPSNMVLAKLSARRWMAV